MYGCLIKVEREMAHRVANTVASKHGSLIQTHSPPLPEIILTNLRCQLVILTLLMAIKLLLMTEVWSDFPQQHYNTHDDAAVVVRHTFYHGEY